MVFRVVRLSASFASLSQSFRLALFTSKLLEKTAQLFCQKVSIFQSSIREKFFHNRIVKCCAREWNFANCMKTHEKCFVNGSRANLHFVAQTFLNDFPYLCLYPLVLLACRALYTRTETRPTQGWQFALTCNKLIIKSRNSIKKWLAQHWFMTWLRNSIQEKQLTTSTVLFCFQVQSAARRAQITTDETMWMAKREKAIEQPTCSGLKLSLAHMVVARHDCWLLFSFSSVSSLA